MSKPLLSLQESPCYNCGCMDRCNEKVARVPVFQEIQDAVFGDKNFDYHACGLWIALNAPEMIEVDEDGN